jgi:MSHA biogenesis protein MshK
MRRLVTMLAASLLAPVAHAAPFADPTQPPVVSDSIGATSGGTRIESILIAPDRRVAVISGQQVTIGSRIGSGTVVRITETEVVVRGAEGEQTLKLFPEVARSAAAPVQRGKAK